MSPKYKDSVDKGSDEMILFPQHTYCMYYCKGHSLVRYVFLASKDAVYCIDASSCNDILLSNNKLCKISFMQHKKILLRGPGGAHLLSRKGRYITFLGKIDIFWGFTSSIFICPGTLVQYCIMYMIVILFKKI